jgi:hypothetical protein
MQREAACGFAVPAGNQDDPAFGSRVLPCPDIRSCPTLRGSRGRALGTRWWRI